MPPVFGLAQDDERLVDGVSALNKTPIEYGELDPQFERVVRSTEQDVYYWYYATQATHHMEGKIWDDWNKVMREQVPAHQIKKGPEAGSWSPLGDKWGTSGRLYVTCLSIYILEVYYRHLPIYSGYKAFAAADAATGASGDAKLPENVPPKSNEPHSGDPAVEDRSRRGRWGGESSPEAGQGGP